MTTRTVRRRRAFALVTAAACLALPACSAGRGSASAPSPDEWASAATGPEVPLVPTRTSAEGSADEPTTATPAATPGGGLTIALAGDSNAEGQAGRFVAEGLGGLGRVLGGADVAIVNLETAIAADRAGLRPQPKTFTFLTDGRYLDALTKQGVDAVTAANNHGLDYGREGLARTLQARSDARPTIVGIGGDDAEAWRPWTTTVRGRQVVLFGASDVLDDGFDWAAGPGRPGMALVKSDADLTRMVDAVRGARAAGPGDVIVVYLHAGVERQTCPTDRQHRLARDLAAAGADVVAMSHAHVLGPATRVGRTAVAYGLGNFIFASRREEQRRTGVLLLSVPPVGGGAPAAQWRPGRIDGGLPRALSGAEAEAATRRWVGLAAQCGVNAS